MYKSNIHHVHKLDGDNVSKTLNQNQQSLIMWSLMSCLVALGEILNNTTYQIFPSY